MATLEIPSNVKCITSGQVPTTTNLKDGEFAFGKVGGVAKLYGNVNGVIIDFTGDGDGIEPGTGEGAVQQVGAEAKGKQSAAFGGLRYDKQTGRTPTSADGNQSFAAGGSVHAEGDFSAVFGKDTIARQRASFAAGSSTAGMTEEEFNAFYWDSTFDIGINGGSKNADGQICDFTGAPYNKSFAFSAALGCDCEAKGARSFAAGDNTKALNTGATATGARTTASGTNSFATGADTMAQGDQSFAVNQSTKASGYNASAFGLHTEAAGNHSAVFGEETQATAPASVAEGYKTVASGEHSHAGGGQFTEAGGLNSFAFGANVHANGENTSTFGYETIANVPNSFVVGKDNLIRDNALFQVGNGTNWNDRKDAFAVLSDGRAKVQTAPVDYDDVVRKQELNSLAGGGSKHYKHYLSIDFVHNTSSDTATIYMTDINYAYITISDANSVISACFPSQESPKYPLTYHEATGFYGATPVVAIKYNGSKVYAVTTAGEKDITPNVGMWLVADYVVDISTNIKPVTT